MRINTNIPAMQARTQLDAANKTVERALAMLASGKRITSAGDDAAGLAVGTQLDTQYRSYQMATRNALDGLSLTEAADAALSTQADTVGRLRELAVQSANGSLSAADRAGLDKERAALTAELDRQAGGAEFNGTKLLSGGATLTFQVGPNAGDQLGVTLVDGTAQGLGLSGLSFATQAGAQGSLAALDQALSGVAANRASLGAAQSRLGTTIRQSQAIALGIAEASSRIQDADVAAATSQLAMGQIRAQAGVAVAAQANRLGASALKLLW